MVTEDALLAPSTEILVSPSRELRSVLVPAPLFTPTPKAAKRVLEFFTAQINNRHTRKAYLNATRRCWAPTKRSGAALTASASSPTCSPSMSLPGAREGPPGRVFAAHGQARPLSLAKMRSPRMLFDWLVTGHVLDVNPAHAVRGPKFSPPTVRRQEGQNAVVLTAEEARELLDSIKTVRKTKSQDGTETEQPSLVGLRDRALIGAMVYTFARVGAVLQMKVRDYFVQGRRGWVRLHEKGGKEHEVPCHHSLEQYLDEYIAAAGIAGDPDAPLFQTVVGKTGALTGKALWQQDAYRMIQRRTRGTDIKTRIGNHTFRATGITAYLKNKGTLEAAQHSLEQSPTTSHRARRSSTTGGRMRLLWMKSSGLRFS